jgi:hypothetical protein
MQATELNRWADVECWAGTDAGGVDPDVHAAGHGRGPSVAAREGGMPLPSAAGMVLDMLLIGLLCGRVSFVC